MAYMATFVSEDPLNYFLQVGSEEPCLRVSDVLLRVNQNPKEIFSHLIRAATNSKWSHSALVYLLSDPGMGYNNTFLIEAKTKGVHLASWRNEVVPYNEFTVGIKRPLLDWYVETAKEQARHDCFDAEDTHGIHYLRHVRGIALDQINGLYDRKTVFELSALYVERVAKRHLSAVPQVAEAAEQVANLFKKWDEADSSAQDILRFICSGLVQYSFFEALRIRIINGMKQPESEEAARHNLDNLHRVIYREDAEGIIPDYVARIQAGKLSIADAIPDDVLDLLKTAVPADFHNSTNLQWRYLIRQGMVWKIEGVADGYTPQSDDEKQVLELIMPEHPGEDKVDY